MSAPCPPEIRIRPIVAADMAPCRPLTFRTLHPLLEAACQANTAFPCSGFVAEHRDAGIAGLALIGPQMFDRSALQLHSLMVNRAFRRTGVGKALLTTAQTHLPTQTSAPLRTEWSDRLPEAAAFAATLTACGWAAPRRGLLRIQGPVRYTPLMIPRREAMLARAARQGITLTRWTDMTPQDRADLTAACDHWHADGTLPDWADPRYALQTPPSPYALLLRDGAGEAGIAGWILCLHHDQPRRWVFPTGWVRPDLTRRGLLMLTLADVTLRLHREQGPEAIAAFETSYDTPDMWDLLERHFVPHAHLSGMIVDRLLNSSYPT